MENMNNEFCFTAPQNSGRLDSFISKESGLSRTKVKKLIEEGFVHINGVVCKNTSLKLAGAEEIKMQTPQVDNTLVASNTPLEIIYQDADIAVINKNPGLTVHPCPSCEEETLVHQLLYHFPQLKEMEGERPGIVHRLDKDTSGLMIIALHEEARLRLATAFAEKSVNKTYLALVPGLCPNDISQESIGRHPSYKTKMAQVPLNKGGRDAHSEWERLYPPIFEEAVTKRGKNVPVPKEFQSSFSLMAVKIYTGRTHQVRVHMSEAGYPLLGDSTYANAKIAQLAPRQMLHAWKLHFHHPITDEELSFTCPLPQDFIQTIQDLWVKEICFQKIIITGSSGTGKSALLNAFANKNIPTFNADTCIQSLYEPQKDAWYILRSQYGQRFVPDEENKVDKKALFNAMQDNIMRKEIENITHPLVFAKLEAFFDEEEQKACKENTKQSKLLSSTEMASLNSPSTEEQDATDTEDQSTTQTDNFCQFAVAEIPLWHESKFNTNIKDTTVISITCENETRQKRLKSRGWDEKTIAQMDAWQWTQEDKAKASHYTIDNTNELESLENKTNELISNITNAQKMHLRKKFRTLQKSMQNHTI